MDRPARARASVATQYVLSAAGCADAPGPEGYEFYSSATRNGQEGTHNHRYAAYRYCCTWTFDGPHRRPDARGNNAQPLAAGNEGWRESDGRGARGSPPVTRNGK